MMVGANLQTVEPFRLAGFVFGRLQGAIVNLPVIAVRSVLVHLVLQQAGISPSWGKPAPDALATLLVAGCAFYGIVGSYVAMRFGSERSIRHVLVWGVLGLGVSLAAATWGGKPEVIRIVTAEACRVRSDAFSRVESYFA
jgi:hypothetical protein